MPNFTNIANDDPTANATDKEDEEQQKLKIDELPDVMLANISSFLDLQSFIHFEQSNRFIFTTIRSLPTMELTDETFMKYLQFTMDEDNKPFYDLDRFKLSKHLHINLDGAEDLAPLISLRDLSICQNLSSLKISLHDDTDNPYRYHRIGKPEFEKYIFDEIKQFDCLSDITSFSFFGWIEEVSYFDPSVLQSMINLKSIHIDNYLAENYPDPCIIEKFASCMSNLSKLRSLSFCSTYVTLNLNPILRAIGHQLEVLDLSKMPISNAGSYDEEQFQNVHLQNLKELHLAYPSKGAIDCLLDQCGMEQLEKIFINASYYDVDVTDEHKQSLVSLLSFRTINEIHVEGYNYEKNRLRMMMKIIERAIKRNKYEEMKIDLDCAREAADDVIAHLKDLMATMEVQCKKFCIDCRFKDNGRNHADDIYKFIELKGQQKDISIKATTHNRLGDLRHRLSCAKKS